MSKIDVSDLEREELPEGKFPVDPRQPFRLQIAPEVHRGVQSHAKADLSVEICGILVGRWGRDELGPFAQVTDYIRCENASSKLAEVTFTHESWAQINHEMDTKYADKRIVGWYHTHPDFGIFLSDRDSFIHEHFFSGAGQVAYVVDPVRDLEGVFSWQNGKPTPMTHYWVGNELRTVQAGERSASHRAESMSAVQDAVPFNAPAASAAYERAPFSSTTMLLAGLSLFLLGYLLAGSRAQLDEARRIEDAVAHFYSKELRVGLGPEIAKVQQGLRTIQEGLAKVPAPSAKLSDAEIEKAQKDLQALRDNLQVAVQSLERIRNVHAITQEELTAYTQLVALKYAELERLLQAQRPTRTPASTASPKTRSKAVEAAPVKGAPLNAPSASGNADSNSEAAAGSDDNDS
jgi:proteasome lid subunit RPN8/RPN11